MDEIARELNLMSETQKDRIVRMLRGLAAMELVDEFEVGKFRLSEDGKYLASDHEESVANYAKMSGEEHYETWASFSKILDVSASSKASPAARRSCSVCIEAMESAQRSCCCNSLS